jgi:hypothetical protein
MPRSGYKENPDESNPLDKDLTKKEFPNNGESLIFGSKKNSKNSSGSFII